MRAVIQRVASAAVKLNNEEISRIGAGFLVLVAVKLGDSEKEVKKMAKKIANLRILKDAGGKMNLSLLDKKQSILLVSQFTLYGDCERCNRPSFMQSARPEQALLLFNLLRTELKKFVTNVQIGAFGEHMQIDLINDGPTTIVLDI
jgi:D-tyrosyl-tRNA(Tyr) deacylase